MFWQKFNICDIKWLMRLKKMVPLIEGSRD